MAFCCLSIFPALLAGRETTDKHLTSQWLLRMKEDRTSSLDSAPFSLNRNPNFDNVGSSYVPYMFQESTSCFPSIMEVIIFELHDQTSCVMWTSQIVVQWWWNYILMYTYNNSMEWRRRVASCITVVLLLMIPTIQWSKEEAAIPQREREIGQVCHLRSSQDHLFGLRRACVKDSVFCSWMRHGTPVKHLKSKKK